MTAHYGTLLLLLLLLLLLFYYFILLYFFEKSKLNLYQPKLYILIKE